jgi:hypothetical protein
VPGDAPRPPSAITWSWLETPKNKKTLKVIPQGFATDKGRFMILFFIVMG